MGQAAIAWQRVLRHLGLTGEVYADEVAPSWRSLVRPASELRPGSGDLVLYHHGIASPLAGRLMHLPCRRGVVYHNVTPPRFYAGTQLEEALRSGRAQLAALANQVELSIGVSRYNARELEVAGHQNVKVVPLFVEPERFSAVCADAGLAAELSKAGRPRVVSVSRVVPHKRMEDLLALHAELLRVAPRAELWVVGGFAPGNTAFRSLKQKADALGGVRFLGRVSHAQLVAAYRSADVFVSMSEHEGFGVPLVEAMASDLPVLAFGAAAVPETMGGRGITFDEKHFAALAETVQLVTNEPELRLKVATGQRQRVAELSFGATREAFRSCLPLGKRSGQRREKVERPRVAVVVQRYGAELTGGAEAHARQVALHLAPHAQVEVLTTCAADYLTWANASPPGSSQDGPITVHRFPVRRQRQMRPFNRLSDKLFKQSQDFVSESHWLAEQGPLAPELLQAIAERASDFDAFIFFTYLYAPTAWGVPLVAHKALVVPTAHDEPPLGFGALQDVFTAPQALLCNTPEEVSLIEHRFPGASRRRVVGVGIEAQVGDERRFRDTFHVRGPYLLYLGRMEKGKGVADLVRRHQELVAQREDAPTLVLAGAGALEPRGKRVACVGRIDEQSKWDALAGAMAVAVPSRYESLSLLALEAFASGTPVIGNEASDVVRGQLERSGGGVAFALDDEASFCQAVRRVGEERERMGRSGKRYAAQFRWEAVVAAYLEEIEELRRKT